MQNDIYIKVVLTVIAVSLVGILIKDTPIIPTAHARGLSDDREPISVNIAGVGGHRFNTFELNELNVALPIKIAK